MRHRIARLIRATANPMYEHEQGEPYETCLALRNKLIRVYEGKMPLDIYDLRDLMTELKDTWDNVLIARKRALGARITEAWFTNSQEMDDFVSYLTFLSERGVSDAELDKHFVNIFNYALNGETNG